MLQRLEIEQKRDKNRGVPKMIIYADITFTKPLESAPPVSSIWLVIDGTEYCATWDETDMGTDNEEENTYCYRFKGVLFDNECANGFFKSNPTPDIKITAICFDEDEVWDIFEKNDEACPQIVCARAMVHDDDIEIDIPDYTELKEQDNKKGKKSVNSRSIFRGGKR